MPRHRQFRVLAAAVVPLLLAAFEVRAGAAPAHRPSEIRGVTSGCGQWTVVPSPDAGAADNELQGVAIVSPDDVWAAGWFVTPTDEENTLILQWDGTVWNLVASPDAGTGDNYLAGIASVGPDEVWAVGHWEDASGVSRTLALRFDGTSWTIVPTPDTAGPGELLAVAAAGPDDVWAVGDRTAPSGIHRSLIEHWDGLGWSIAPSPNVGRGANTLLGATAFSSTDAWAVGRSTAVSGSHRTLTEHWNGSTWAVGPSADAGSSNDGLYAVAGVASDDLWAAGRRLGTSTYRTLIEHWDGASWVITPSPNDGIGFNVLYGVAAVSSTDVWTVGDADGRTSLGRRLGYVAHWDGAAWSAVRNRRASPKDNDLEAASALPSGEAWAVGYDGPDAAARTLVEHYCPS